LTGAAALVLCVAKSMRDLHDALEQIREIRAGVARSRLYRGYRAGPTALTGCLAALAALLQTRVAGDPAAYLALWTGCAAASAAVVGASMLAAPSPRTREALTRLAWPVVAGALVTAALHESAPQLLPGLWQVFFALALFASLPLLPRPMVLVALFYLACGLLVLGSTAPASMGIPFATGQFAAALILHRHHG